MKTYLLSRTVAGACLLGVGMLLADPVPYNHIDGRLVYDPARSEDFSVETAVDPAKWTITPQTAIGLGADNPSNVAITGNALVLTGLKLTTPVKGCYYSGASLTSVLRHGYGYYEIYAMMPTQGAGWTSYLSASGASNSLTLVSFNSNDNSSISQAAGYVSAYNRINGYPASTYRYSTFNYFSNLVSTLSPPPGFSPKDGFHYYGVEWTPREIITYFDGNEVQRIPYPGPHSPVTLKLGLSARSVVSPAAPVTGAEFKVKHVRHWTKNYDVTRLDVAVVPVPTDLITHYPDSQLAFNHKVFDWDVVTKKYTTRPGDSLGSKPLASGDSANPVYQYYSSADLARWNYNGTAAAADVFAWNPSMYPTTFLQAEFSGAPLENLARYAIVGNGSATAATVTVSQVHDGQQWAWLGVHAFTPGSGYVKVTADAWTPELGVRAAAMQFRQLNYFYDDFSAALSGWTPSGGSWASGGGVLAQNSTSPTGLALLLRSSSAAWADCFVRSRVKFAGASPAKNISLVGRYQAGGNHYLLRLSPPVTSGPYILDLLRANSGVFTTLATVALDPAIDPGANFTDLHLFMRGNNLQGLVDGELVLEFTDTAAGAILTTGQAGVRTYGGTAQFAKAGAGQ